MKNYRVITPPDVERVIRDRVLHIAHDSIGNALAWEDRLRSAIRRIGTLPGGYPVDADASERFGEPVRKVVFEQTYLIFYVVDDAAKTAVVVNIRHGARFPRSAEP